MKWRKFLVPVLIIGLPIIGVSSCIIRDDQLDRNFQAVKPGMSAAEVKQNMGSPSWDSDGGNGWLPKIGSSTKCVRELGYSATMAWTGFAPMWWVMCIGPDDTVIRTAKIVSP